MAKFGSSKSAQARRAVEAVQEVYPFSQFYSNEEDGLHVVNKQLAVLTELGEYRNTLKQRLADENHLLSSYIKECENRTKQLEDLQKENATLKEASHRTEEECSSLDRDLELLSLEEKQLEEIDQADTALEDTESLLATATGIQWEDSTENEASGVIITPKNMKPFEVNLKEKSHAYASNYIWNLLEDEVLNKATES